MINSISFQFCRLSYDQEILGHRLHLMGKKQYDLCCGEKSLVSAFFHMILMRLGSRKKVVFNDHVAGEEMLAFVCHYSETQLQEI